VVELVDNNNDVLREITKTVEELEKTFDERYGHLRLIERFLDNLPEERRRRIP
jgi:hypothetical protein